MKMNELSEIKEALSKEEVTDNILNYCLSLKQKAEVKWEEYYYAAKLLDKINSEGEYDKTIIEYLEISNQKGLNINNAKEQFIDALKILAGLYLKYSDYKKANNCLTIIQDYFEESPEWIKKLKANVHINIYLDMYLRYPESFFEKILMYDGKRELLDYEISIIRSFLYKCYGQLKNNNYNVGDKIKFYLDCFNILQNNPTNFSDEIERITDELISLGEEGLTESNKLENRYLIFIISKLYKDIKEIKITTQEEINNIKNKITSINEEFSRQIVDEIRKTTPELTTPEEVSCKNIKILILGDIQIPTNEIFGIAKREYGIPSKNIDIINDWDKIKSYDVEKLRYNSKYDGIIVGPIPHSIKGVGEFSNLIPLLQRKEGFPFHVVVRDSAGDLKITKTAFKEALKELIENIKSQNI